MEQRYLLRACVVGYATASKCHTSCAFYRALRHYLTNVAMQYCFFWLRAHWTINIVVFLVDEASLCPQHIHTLSCIKSWLNPSKIKTALAVGATLHRPTPTISVCVCVKEQSSVNGIIKIELHPPQSLCVQCTPYIDPKIEANSTTAGDSFELNRNVSDTSRTFIKATPTTNRQRQRRLTKATWQLFNERK